MPIPLPVVAILLSGCVVGLLPALVDCIKTALAQRLGLSEQRAEQLPAVFYLCWLPGMPLAGWLADAAGDDQGAACKALLFYGLLGIVLGITWLALVHTTWGCVSNLVLLGLAYSCVTTATVYAMPHLLAFHSSAVAAMNLGFVPVGVGALLGPGLIARCQRRWGYRQGLLLLAGCMLLPATLTALSPADSFPSHAGSSSSEGVLRQPQLGLIAMALLLYFLIENCLDVWPRPYLQELGHSQGGVRFGLFTFWGAFLLARLAVGLFGASSSESWLLLSLALCAAFALGNLVGAYGSSSGSFGFWIVGACYGPLLPGALALVPDLCPEKPATALGVLLALSGLDTLLFRPFLVAFAQKQPAHTVMRVPTILALVLAAPLLVLALLRS